MRMHQRALLIVCGLVPLCAANARPASHARRAVYLDSAGVVRWQDDKHEVRLFGANYVVPTASDYRAAGYVHADRKKMIDEDMAHFARMEFSIFPGWTGYVFWRLGLVDLYHRRFARRMPRPARPDRYVARGVPTISPPRTEPSLTRIAAVE